MKKKLVVQSTLVALAGALLMPGATGPFPERVAEASDRAAPSVVLITVDGTRWQEVFGGADPELARRAGLGEARVTAEELMPSCRRLFFAEGTVLGAPGAGPGFHASGPNFVSLPGYTELMTGAPSACQSNDCDPIRVPTLFDAAAALRGPRAVFASWGTVADAVAREEVAEVHAGQDFPGPLPPYPGLGTYQPDHATAEQALAYLRTERPRLLWLALGDTDEYAHRGDYRRYVEALRYADSVVGRVVDTLAELGTYGRNTTVVVTADHGRDADWTDHGGPDSSALWLMARGPRVRAAGAVPTAERRHLRDVAPTLRVVLGLPQAPDCAACGHPLPELTR